MNSTKIDTAVPQVQKTPENIMKLGMAFWGSKCLLSAFEHLVGPDSMVVGIK